jgi:hypothetical protein
MYLTEPSLSTIVKKQYIYKLKSYLGFYAGLIIVQVLAMLTTFNGVSRMYSGGNQFEVETILFSNEATIVFTFFWIFIISIVVTTKDYRGVDASFISNQLSTNLANFLYLLTVGIACSISAILSGSLVRVLLYYIDRNQIILGEHFHLTISDLLLSILVTFLYVFLLSMLGYFIGMLVQLFKPFVVIIPVGIIGLLILEGASINTLNAVEFYIFETSLFLFTLKVLITAAALFICVHLFSSKLEVRK